MLSVARATRPLPGSDGSLYFASNRDGHAQVYRLSSAGAAPARVLASKTRMVPHAHTPLGLLVREDSGGNEVWQLGLITESGYRALTADTKAVHQSVTLHPDRRRAGLGWNPGGQGDIVLGELDLASGATTRWAEPGGFWQWGAWNPDGTRAVVMKVLGTPTAAHTLERDGTLTRLLATAQRVHPIAWHAEGILVLTDLQRDFLGLAVIDPDRPDAVERWLFDEDRDLEGVAIDDSGAKAAIVVNEGTFDGIRIIDLAEGRELDRVVLPPGIVIADHSGDPDEIGRASCRERV